MAQQHSYLINTTLLKIGTIPWLKVWRNETGEGRRLYSNERIKYGKVGSGDIIGWLSVGGLAIFISMDAKTGKDKLSEEQVNFGSVLMNHGGIFFSFYSADEALDKINEAREIIEKKLKALASGALAPNRGE